MIACSHASRRGVQKDLDLIVIVQPVARGDECLRLLIGRAPVSPPEIHFSLLHTVCHDVAVDVVSFWGVGESAVSRTRGGKSLKQRRARPKWESPRGVLHPY